MLWDGLTQAGDAGRTPESMKRDAEHTFQMLHFNHVYNLEGKYWLCDTNPGENLENESQNKKFEILPGVNIQILLL